MNLSNVFYDIICANEGDPKDPDYWLKFTDPDGVRSGKSGWSFARCQFDISNNPFSFVCLKKCGFTDAEIEGLRYQTIDVKPLEEKLREHADVIAQFDEQQLDGCLTRARVILEKFGILPADDAAILAVADYDNQYHLEAVNSPKKLVGYLSGLGRPFMAKDVLDFKLEHTKYGKVNPADCQRRYMNILRIVQNG